MKVTNLGNYLLKPQAPFGWDENKEDRKEKEKNRVENRILSYLTHERKQEGKEMV